MDTLKYPPLVLFKEMSSIVSQAKSIYRNEGLINLLRSGFWFGIQEFFQHVVWSILPKDKVFQTIAQSRVLTSLYFLFRGTFYHEQQAILCGVAEYHRIEEKRRSPKHRIIRNTHRIEKGLSIPDTRQRDTFAEGYIKDIIRDLEIAWNQAGNDTQLQWTIDVLNEYFETVKSTEKISKAQKQFDKFLQQIEYCPQDRVPFPRREIQTTSISPEEIKRLAVQRTSTRWFQQRDVPRKLIDQSLEVAMQSPSACNRQSYEFQIYDDPELISKITDLAIGAGGYSDNIPCLAVIVGKQRAYFNARDKHVIYIDASLAAMAFQFSLETQNLASCCINWPTIPRNERKMTNLLGLNCDEQVIMLMAIGYPDPDGMIPYSEKKPVDAIRSYNILNRASSN